MVELYESLSINPSPSVTPVSEEVDARSVIGGGGGEEKKESTDSKGKGREIEDEEEGMYMGQSNRTPESLTEII